MKRAEFAVEREMRAALDEMWGVFEPFADNDFIPAFAHDPDARFWELFLGYSLLQDGRTLLSAAERGNADGLPDICAVDGDKRCWIEAIAPGEGADGPDQVVGPVPINEGGGLIAAPERQVQLRITGALHTKAGAFQRYTERGRIAVDDVRLVAIGACSFGAYASDNPPSALKAVFPIGDKYMRVNRENFEIVEAGIETSWTIARANAEIPRTAFLGDDYHHISGLIWSRVGIGNFNRSVRPISMIHNPVSEVPMPEGWSAWDRENVARRQEDGWQIEDTSARRADL
ncbi:MAG: hypothetical protein AAFY22_08625 [Pseudomonadota bacterium]